MIYAVQRLFSDLHADAAKGEWWSSVDESKAPP
jgi:hypothetical protein